MTHMVKSEPSMTALTHAVVGSRLAMSQSNPILAFGLSLLSHFFLDILPHNDYLYFSFPSKKGRALVLSPVSISLTLTALLIVSSLFLWEKDYRVLTGALAGVLPDLITVALSKTGRAGSLFNRLHSLIHKTASLARVLYRHSAPEPKKSEMTPGVSEANYKLFRRSVPAQVGWCLEMGLEIFVLLTALLSFPRILAL